MNEQTINAAKETMNINGLFAQPNTEPKKNKSSSSTLFIRITNECESPANAKKIHIIE